MKKIICVFLAMLMLLSLCACSASQPAKTSEEISDNQTANVSEKSDDLETGISGTITFAHHRTDLDAEMDALLKAFHEQYPNIIVNIEADGNYKDNIKIRMSGNELPDVFELDSAILDPSEWKNYFQPINDSKFYGKCYFKDVCYDGEDLMGLPQTVAYSCMVYNKALYAQAGITEVPTTWTELDAALEKLSKLDGIIPLTTQYKTNWAIARVATNFVASYKGADWTNSWAETTDPFSDAQLLTTLDNFKSAIDKGYCDPDLMSSDWDLQAADFAAGKIGTYIGGSYIYATMISLGMNPEDIGFYPYPVADMREDGKTAVYVTSGFCFGVSKDTKNYEASLALVDFLAENYAKYTNQAPAVEGAEAGLPVLTELMSDSPAVVDAVRATEKYTAVYNTAGFHPAAIVQEYVISDNPDEVIAKYNEIWNSAVAENE